MANLASQLAQATPTAVPRPQLHKQAPAPRPRPLSTLRETNPLPQRAPPPQQQHARTRRAPSRASRGATAAAESAEEREARERWREVTRPALPSSSTMPATSASATPAAHERTPAGLRAVAPPSAAEAEEAHCDFEQSRRALHAFLSGGTSGGAGSGKGGDVGGARPRCELPSSTVRPVAAGDRRAHATATLSHRPLPPRTAPLPAPLATPVAAAATPQVSATVAIDAPAVEYAGGPTFAERRQAIAQMHAGMMDAKRRQVEAEQAKQAKQAPRPALPSASPSAPALGAGHAAGAPPNQPRWGGGEGGPLSGVAAAAAAAAASRAPPPDSAAGIVPSAGANAQGQRGCAPPLPAAPAQPLSNGTDFPQQGFPDPANGWDEPASL